MTPTLAGRWQTRIFLNMVLGIPITLVYMLLLGLFEEARVNPSFTRDLEFWKLLIILGYVTGFGLLWDIVYIWLQGFRWDQDWPMAFQFLCGIWEGVFIFALFAFNLLPGLRFGEGDAINFLWHYGTVFFVTYWSIWSLMRVLFPRWRLNGGELFS